MTTKSYTRFLGRRACFLFFFVALVTCLQAQFSTVHYLPTPINETGWAINDPEYRLTSLESTPVTVTVTNAATGALLATLTIPPNGQVMWASPYEVVGTDGPSNLGVKMESTESFSVTGYGDLAVSTMALSWVSKGLKGLGTDFRLYGPSMNFRTSGNRGNYYSIIAADTAEVVVTGLPSGSGTYNLLPGQTVVINGGFDTDESLYSGASVTSTGDIAILNQTNQFFNGGINSASGGSDDGADILVPTSLLADDYFIVQGRGGDAREIVTVVAAMDNTEVIVNGTVVATLDDGEHIDLAGAMYWDDITGTPIGTVTFMDVKTSNPAYVWHKTSSGSQDGYVLVPGVSVLNEQNRAVIPETQFDEAQYTVVTVAGSTVTLDGVVQTPVTTVGGNEIYVMTGSTLGAGARVVESNNPINLTALSFAGSAAVGVTYGGFSPATLTLLNQGESTLNTDFDSDSDGRADTCYLYLDPDNYPAYQWLFNGVPLAGETDYFVRADMEGTYGIDVTTSSGLRDTLEFDIGLHNSNCIDACGATSEFGDFDCDGITNMDDIDDDNDGIPDVDECGPIVVVDLMGPDPTFETFSGVARNNGFNSDVTSGAGGWTNGTGSADTWFTPMTSATNNNYGAFMQNASPQGGVFAAAWSTGATNESFYADVTGLVPGQRYTVSFYQANVGHGTRTNVGDEGSWEVHFGSEVQESTPLEFQGRGLQTWQEEREFLTFTATSSTQRLEFFAKRVSPTTTTRLAYMGIDDILLTEGGGASCEDDTDGDGILNVFDLDSDNDRCPDAVEAGHGQPLLPNDMVMGAVYGNGLPIAVASPSPDTNEINYTINTTDAGDYTFLIDSVRADGCPLPQVDTLYDTVAYTESVTICFELDPLIFFPTTIQSCSPPSPMSTPTLGVPDDTCAMIMGNIPGTDTLCFIVCDDSLPALCDTTFVFLTIIDTTGPELSCKVMPDSVYLDVNGMVIIDTSNVLDSVMDISGVDSVWLSDTAFACADTGRQMVTVYGRDAAGNIDSCVAAVIVVDSVAPMIECMTPLTLYLDPSGTAMLDTADLIMSLSDACGIDSVWLSDDDGMMTCDDVGTQMVTVFAQDVSGNIGSCASTIMVMDTVAPEIQCISPVDLHLGPGSMVMIDTAALIMSLTDGCGVDSVWISDADQMYTCDDIGAQMLTVYAMDEGGNIDSCQTMITVIDTISPVVNCLFGDTTLYGCDTSIANVNLFSSIMTSNTCPDDSLWNEDEVFFGSCRDSIHRTWMVMDMSGNLSTCVQDIVIIDSTMPMITCPANASDSLIVYQEGRAGPDRYGFAMATDDCGVMDITYMDDTIPAGSGCSPLILRMWTATDSCGNEVSCEQRITFGDMTPPVISCPEDTTVSCDADLDSSLLGAATATDNVGVETISFTDNLIDGAMSDTVRRMWVAMDSCGIFDTCFQDIVLIDTTAPSFDIVQMDTMTFSCDGPIPVIPPFVATDNCDPNVILDTIIRDNMSEVLDGFERVIVVTAADGVGNVDSLVYTMIFEHQSPIITISEVFCEGDGTYSVRYISNGDVLSANEGTVFDVDNVVRGITVGTSVVLTAEIGIYCRDSVTVFGPPECPPTCVLPDLTLGQGVCNGVGSSTYTVTFNETTGADIVVNGGTNNGDGTVTANLGDQVEIIATNSMFPSCEVSIIVASPPNCDDLCGVSMISMNGPKCNDDESESYVIRYFSPTDVIVLVTPAPALIEQTASEIIVGSGASVVIQTVREGCDTAMVETSGIICPECQSPSLTIGNVSCQADGTWAAAFSTSVDSVVSSQGMVDTMLGVITGLNPGDDVTLYAFKSGNCVDSITVTGPSRCPLQCVLPDLIVGQAVCDGFSASTYTVSYSENTGAMISVTGGTDNGDGTISGTIGTDMVITATNTANSDCEVVQMVTSPADCTDPCESALISLGGPLCSEDGSQTYAVNYSSPSDVIVSVTPLTALVSLTDNRIQIRSGMDVVIEALRVGCDPVRIPVKSIECPECMLPSLTVSEVRCVGDGTYRFNYSTSVDSLVSNEGMVDTMAHEVNSIPAGTDVTVYAYVNGMCYDSMIVEGPSTCPLQCVLPRLSVGQAVCDSVGSTTYTVSYSESTGANITVMGGTDNGDGTITGALGTELVITATNSVNSDCEIVQRVSSPESCTDPCAGALISMSGPQCNEDDSESYVLSYVSPADVQVSVEPAAALMSMTATELVIMSGMDIVVRAIRVGCDTIEIDVRGRECPECMLPNLTIREVTCDGSGTYSVSYLSNVDNVDSDLGIVNLAGNIVNGIPVGMSTFLYAYENGTCVDSIEVTGPSTCPLQCVLPKLSVGQAICDGVGSMTFTVTYSESTGATIAVTGGTDNGDGTITGNVGTPIVITATNASDAACMMEMEITSPVNCDDPCGGPLISMSGPQCNSDESESYVLNFASPDDVEVTIEPNAAILSMSASEIVVISGMDVVVRAVRVGCDTIEIPVSSESCPECQSPSLTIGDVGCEQDGTWSVRYSSNVDSVVSSQGMVDTMIGRVVGLTPGINVVISAFRNGNCIDSITVSGPLSCPLQCVLPDLIVGQAVCDSIGSTTFTVTYSESTGASVSITGGTDNGDGTISGTIGTSIMIRATNPVFGECELIQMVTSPSGCFEACESALISMSGPLCNEDNSESYVVNYVSPADVEVSVEPSAALLTMTDRELVIASGMDVTVSAVRVGCDTVVIPVKGIECPECMLPSLTVGEVSCVGDGTYRFSYNSSVDSLVSSEGMVDTMTHEVSGISAGTNVTIYAYVNGACYDSMIVEGPSACPLQCVLPRLSVGQAVCDGIGSTTFTVTYSESTGANIVITGGTDNGDGTITGSLGTEIVITATNSVNSDCEIVQRVSGPVSCLDPCAGALISISGPQCSYDDSQSYVLNYASPDDVQISVEPSAAVLSMTDRELVIMSGVDVIVQAVRVGCDTVEVDVRGRECPECMLPNLTVREVSCDGFGTYSVTYLTNVDSVASNMGMVDTMNRIVRGIDVGMTVFIYAYENGTCVDSIEVTGPSACPTQCVLPKLSVGQAVCDGVGAMSFTVTYNESTGATISVIGGTDNGDGTITGVLGTPIMITATNASDPSCVLEMMVTSPTNCDDPCGGPLISVSGPQCNEDESESYVLNYVSPTDVVVSVEPSAAVLSMTDREVVIVSGMDVIVRAVRVGCDTVEIPVLSEACPECQSPTITIGDVRCEQDGSWSVRYNTSVDSVVSSQGMVDTMLNRVTGLTPGMDVSVRAYKNGSCVDSIVVTGPSNCPLQCVLPDLIVGQAVCDSIGSSTFTVTYSETTGAAIVVTGGTDNGDGTITGMIGTPIAIVATNSFNSDCEIMQMVTSPSGCFEACESALISISGPSCNIDNSPTFVLNYVAPSDVEVSVIPASVLVSMTDREIVIQSGADLVVRAVRVGCDTVDVPYNCIVCPECMLPSLTVSEVSCVGDGTFKLNYNSSVDSLVSSAGMVDTMTHEVSGIPAGTDVTIYAYAHGICYDSMIVEGPSSCPLQCVLPRLSVGQAVCDSIGSMTFTVTYSESTGANIVVTGGMDNGDGTITGMLGTEVVITATNSANSDCEIVQRVSSPESCIDPCAGALISMSGPQCNEDDSESYVLNYSAPSDVQISVEPSAALLSMTDQEIVVMSGVGVVVRAVRVGCDTAEIDVRGRECPECMLPTLTIREVQCDGFSTYSVSYLTNVDSIASSLGMVDTMNRIVRGVDVGMAVYLYAFENGNCVDSIEVVGPNSCPSDCVLPKLSIGQAVCDGVGSSTFTVAYSESTSATIVVTGGTDNGDGTITGMLGTPVMIRAENTSDANCVLEMEVSSPASCDDACGGPLLSVSGPQCNEDGGESYVLNYVSPGDVEISVEPSAAVVSMTDREIVVMSGMDVTVQAVRVGCDTIEVSVSGEACPACSPPIMFIGKQKCNSSTNEYWVEVTAGGDTLYTDVGILQGDSLIVAPIGMDAVISSVNRGGCEAQITVSSPSSCSDNCAYPDMVLGQGVCAGDGTYSVSLSESTGANVVVVSPAGVVLDVASGFVTGIPIGMNVVVMASHSPDCEVQMEVLSPEDCISEPCEQSKVSLSGPICNGEEASYQLNFIARAGVEMTVNNGEVVGNTIIVPSGEDVEVYATLTGCGTDTIMVRGIECPPCSNPMLSLGYVSCDAEAGTYDINVNTEDDVMLNASAGSFDDRVLRGISLGESVVVTSSRPANCETEMTFVGPSSCPEGCEMPALIVGQGVCQGTGGMYMVSFTEVLGSTITADAGIVSGSSVIDIPLGTDVTIRAMNGACELGVIVKSPEDCSDRCAQPGISLTGPICSADGASEYILNYVAAPGIQVLVDSGVVGASQIVQIPRDHDANVSSYLSGCDTINITFSGPPVDTVYEFLGREDICVFDGVQLNVSSYTIAGNFIPGTWYAIDSVTGMEIEGTFVSSNFAQGNRDSSAVWMPGDSVTGDTTVCFVWVQDYENERCLVEVDTFKARIFPGPMIMVGGDTVTCNSDTIMISGMSMLTTGEELGGMWTVTSMSDPGDVPDGMFGCDTCSETFFIPSVPDDEDMNFYFKWTTEDPEGPCGPLEDSFIVMVSASVVADAGEDSDVCGVSPAQLGARSYVPAVDSTEIGGMWIGGLGEFSDSTDPNALYTPDSSEISCPATPVELIWMSLAPGPEMIRDAVDSNICPPVSDTMILNVWKPAKVTLSTGTDTLLCYDNADIFANIEDLCVVRNGTWEIIQGAGTLSDSTGLVTTYEPSGPGEAFSIILIKFTTDDPEGPCGPVSDTIRLCLASPYLNCVTNLNIGCGDSIRLQDVLVSDFGGPKFEPLYTITIKDAFNNILPNPLPIDYTGDFWIEVGTVCSNKTCETTGTVSKKESCVVSHLLDTTIWCVDEFLGVDPDGEYYEDTLKLRPYGLTDCGGDTIQVSYEGEWITTFDCGDTLKQIIRAWRTETKDGIGCVGYDTITVIRLPELTEYIYAPQKDTVQCKLDTSYWYTFKKQYPSWKQLVNLHNTGSEVIYPIAHSLYGDISELYMDWELIADENLKDSVRDRYEEWPVLVRWNSTTLDYDSFSVLEVYENTSGLFDREIINGEEYAVLSVRKEDRLMSNGGLYVRVGEDWYYEGGEHGFWIDISYPLISYEVEATICDSWETVCSGIELILPDHPYAPDSCKLFCLSEYANESKCLDVVYVEEKELSSSCPRVVKRQTIIKQSCVADGAALATLADVMKPCPRESDDSGIVRDGPSTGSGANIEVEQWIIYMDTLGPLLAEKDGAKELVFQTSEHDCFGEVDLPSIEVKDVCSGVKSVKATTGIGNSWITFNDADGDGIWVMDADVHKIRLACGESYAVHYEVMDNCHNVSEITRHWVSVEDRVNPVVLTADTLNLSLGGKEVWLEGSVFDRGSSDNCGVRRVLVRRTDWLENCGVDVCPTTGLGDIASLAELASYISSNGYIGGLRDNAIEQYYADQYEWLVNDGNWCPITEKERKAGLQSLQDLLIEGWRQDIRNYWIEECGIEDAHGNSLLARDDNYSIGGGWGDKVAICCEDACKEVIVEVLVIDKNCNYTKGWTVVNVEDKSSVEQACEFEDVEMGCSAYESYYADLIVAAQDEGSEEAFDALDEALGGLVKGWESETGVLVDYDGNALAKDMSYQTTQCRIEVVERKVLDTAHDGEVVWKLVKEGRSVIEEVTKEAALGGVFVKCGSRCERSVWVELNDCGVGKITRRWEVYGGCASAGSLATEAHSGAPLIIDQVIWVRSDCELSKYSLDIPNDTMICDDLTYSLDGNVDIDGGDLMYALEDADCRQLGIGYKDEVFNVIGAQNLKKIHRTWRVSDWCNNEEVECVQKIVLDTDCSGAASVAGGEKEGVSREANAEALLQAQGTFELYQNTPNPFANETVVRFRLPEASAAKLTLFDLSGRILYELDAEYEAGTHEVLINSKELSDNEVSGVLFYQVETATHSATKQMTILK